MDRLYKLHENCMYNIKEYIHENVLDLLHYLCHQIHYIIPQFTALVYYSRD